VFAIDILDSPPEPFPSEATHLGRIATRLTWRQRLPGHWQRRASWAEAEAHCNLERSKMLQLRRCDSGQRLGEDVCLLLAALTKRDERTDIGKQTCPERLAELADSLWRERYTDSVGVDTCSGPTVDA
jgi:hypothetical protein